MVERQKIEANRWCEHQQKGAGIVLSVSDNADFKARTISRDKEKDFIMLRKTQTITRDNLSVVCIQ